jgi:hypothetical protein
MKYTAKRRGFCPRAVKKLAERSDYAVWAVLCLANEGCVLGDEHPTTLLNCLTRCFGKYAKIYGAFVDLRTGEVNPRCSVNRCYGNRLSHEILDMEVKKEVLAQLECRLWRYLFETGLKLWMAGLEGESKAK